MNKKEVEKKINKDIRFDIFLFVVLGLIFIYNFLAERMLDLVFIGIVLCLANISFSENRIKLFILNKGRGW